jgi:hypothetical protein
MRKIATFLAFTFALLTQAAAQGTLPIVLQQQFSFSGCASTPTTGACGQPLSGGLLYFYQVGTVATQQNSFQDTGLTILNPWPLQLDANGRVPPFYLASGSVHVRLTDSSGVQQFDYPSMLVIGPSGGGGGGTTVDPTTVLSTGDIKFRMTGELVTGWVKMNGLTIGNATSGATLRANADTQALFVYLWTNCGNAHCPIAGGYGASALTDFNNSKQLAVPDWRGRQATGLDDMGATASGRIAAGNVTSGGDTVTTPGASGGISTLTLAQNQLPNIVPTLTGTPGSLTFAGALISLGTLNTNQNVSQANATFGSGGFNAGATPTLPASVTIPNFTPAGNINYAGQTANTLTPIGTVSSINGGVGQTAMLTMNPFMLGSWYMKL